MNEKVLIIVVCVIGLLECILIPLISHACYKHDCKKYGKDIMEKWRDGE